MATIYKICPEPLWQTAEAAGHLGHLGIDKRDGYIHFSTASQVAETLRLYFAGVDNLVLAAVDSNRLGDRLRYEAARGGQLFPHLYDVLPMSAVLWAKPLAIGKDGGHVVPDDVS
jgi:uncharacterized protein (DUF952 family)